MIRLKQVLAVAQERNTRIGDDGDDRDRKYFDRDYLPAFERSQVGDAFAIDDGVRASIRVRAFAPLHVSGRELWQDRGSNGCLHAAPIKVRPLAPL
jgi:hypothetical protein